MKTITRNLLFFILLAVSAIAQAQISGPGSITSSPAVMTTDQAKTPNYLITTASFSHTMLAQANSFLRVDCSKNTWPGTKVTGVTANGIAMVNAAQIKGLAANKPTDTSSWYLTGLPAGTVSIVASSTGGATSGYGSSCLARDYYGVDQASPITQIDTDNIPVNTTQVTCNFVTNVDGQVISIFEYSTAYNQTSPTSASPFAAEFSTGRYFAEQMGMAEIAVPIAGSSLSETWTEHNSTISVQWSLIGLFLRPAQS